MGHRIAEGRRRVGSEQRRQRLGISAQFHFRCRGRQQVVLLMGSLLRMLLLVRNIMATATDYLPVR